MYFKPDSKRPVPPGCQTTPTPSLTSVSSDPTNNGSLSGTNLTHFQSRPARGQRSDFCFGDGSVSLSAWHEDAPIVSLQLLTLRQQPGPNLLVRQVLSVPEKRTSESLSNKHRVASQPALDKGPPLQPLVGLADPKSHRVGANGQIGIP